MSDYINVYFGDEVCRAYLNPPTPSSSLGILNWEDFASAEFYPTYNNGNPPIETTVNLRGVVDKSVKVQLDWTIRSGAFIPGAPSTIGSLTDRIHAFDYDEDMQEYAFRRLNCYSPAGGLVSDTIVPTVVDVWSADANTPSLCLEYKIKIIQLNGADKINLLAFDSNNDPADKANALRFVLQVATGDVGVEYGVLPSSFVNSSVNHPLSENIVYTIRQYVTYDANTYYFTHKIYIDDDLRCEGSIRELRTHSDYYQDGCFFRTTPASNALVSWGSIKAFAELPVPDYKKICIKKNGNTYYLLCSLEGRYPSLRAKAKIDGITYPILLKYDGDTSE